MRPKLKLVINGFSTGVFLTLFFVTLALGMNPALFFIAAMLTGGLVVLGLNHDI
jgi:hypothetical protein